MNKKYLSISLGVTIFVAMIEIMYFSESGKSFAFIAGYASSYIIAVLFYKILFYKDSQNNRGSNE